MDIKIIENLDYANYQDRIIKFLNDNDQYTVFHDPRFLAYHKDSNNPIENYEFMDIIIEKSGVILAYLPGGIDRNTNAYISHKGASFSGPVFRKSSSIAEKQDLLQKIIVYLEEQSTKEIVIKLPPQFYLHDVQHQDLEWILYEENFQEMQKDAPVYLDITNPISLKSFSPSTRRNVKKGQKMNYTIKQDTDITIFYEILLSNRKKFSALPTHSLENLQFIQQSIPDSFTFFLLYTDDTPIAGMGIFKVNKAVINLFYPCHIRDYSHLRPNNVLLFEIIKWAQKEQYKGIDFGPSNFGTSLNHDLINYKLGYGGSVMIRSTYKRVL